jgi:bacteriocin-like protein
MTEQQDPKTPNAPQTSQDEEELQKDELDQVSGGVALGSFGNLAAPTRKAKIKVGGVGNWDEDEK